MNRTINGTDVVIAPITSTLAKASDRLKFSLATVLATTLVTNTNQFDNILQLNWSRPRAVEQANLIALRFAKLPNIVNDNSITWLKPKTTIGQYQLVKVSNDAGFDYFPFLHFNFVSVSINYNINVNLNDINIIDNNINYDNNLLTIQADSWGMAILILAAVKQFNENAMTALQANKFIYLLYPKLQGDDSQILTLLEEYVFDYAKGNVNY